MFHFIHRNVKKLFYEVARGFKSFVLVLSGKAGIFLKMVRIKVHKYILTLCLLRVIRTLSLPNILLRVGSLQEYGVINDDTKFSLTQNLYAISILYLPL